jgi:hypothetical protein
MRQPVPSIVGARCSAGTVAWERERERSIKANEKSFSSRAGRSHYHLASRSRPPMLSHTPGIFVRLSCLLTQFTFGAGPPEQAPTQSTARGSWRLRRNSAGDVGSIAAFVYFRQSRKYVMLAKPPGLGRADTKSFGIANDNTVEATAWQCSTHSAFIYRVAMVGTTAHWSHPAPRRGTRPSASTPTASA